MKAKLDPRALAAASYLNDHKALLGGADHPVLAGRSFAAQKRSARLA